MIKRPLPPYGRQITIPPLPYLVINVNEPECWRLCKQDRELGFNNNLCLPDIKEAINYRWPVKNLPLIINIFGDPSEDDCLHLVEIIGSYEPEEIAVRRWPGTTVVSYRPEEAVA